MSNNELVNRMRSAALQFLCPTALAACTALLLAINPASAALDTNRVNEIAAMLSPKAAAPGRTIADRAAWERLAHEAGFASVIATAEQLAKSPPPEMTEELFLDYSRTGNRDRGQRVMFARADRLATFSLAECLENRGRFIGPLTNEIDVLCAERTWVYPAHDSKLDNFYGRTVSLDLRSTALAWELATLDYLLADKLPAPTRKLLRDNVRRRVLQPYRDVMEGRRPETQIHWLNVKNNWNAVCLAGVTGAALAIEDAPADRALFIAASEYYIRNFFTGFTPDGYCNEGLGYWNYGFGRFVQLAETVRQATDGKIDFFTVPKAQAAALFASRDEIFNGIYPTIADCNPGSRPDDHITRFAEERFGLATTPRGGIFLRPAGTIAATTMYAFLPEKLPVAQRADKSGESPLRSWFKEGGLLICRNGPSNKSTFGAVLKGGHNAESHNHNDVGSFSVVTGNTMVLCDPGGEVYTALTFSPRRYESKVNNSFGHAVPTIAGKLQSVGQQAHAVIVRSDFTDTADTLTYDIASAYDVPELKKLERTFVFQRTSPPTLTVKDEVAFSKAQPFETALITWGDWKKTSDSEISVRDGHDAVRVKIDTGGVPFEVRSEVIEADVHTRTKPKHIGIVLNSPLEKATVTLTITPEAVPN